MRTTQIDAVSTLDPIEALDHAVRRLMWVEQKRLGQMLADDNVTVPQFFVLVNLMHHERGCTATELAGKLFQSNPTMTGIIDRLEDYHLVTRKRGGEVDRRKVIVQLTEKGRALLERTKQARREHFRRALAQLPPRDVQNFVRVMNAYVKHLEEAS